MYYYIFMTALVAFGHLPEKGFPLNDFRRADFTSRPQSFGHEANALPKLCKCYAYSTIKAPDKGEVGGSSPPRPTIQILNIYAAIHTFLRSGDLCLKASLPTICQLFGHWDAVTLGVIQG